MESIQSMISSKYWKEITTNQKLCIQKTTVQEWGWNKKNFSKLKTEMIVNRVSLKEDLKDCTSRRSKRDLRY